MYLQYYLLGYRINRYNLVTECENIFYLIVTTLMFHLHRCHLVTKIPVLLQTGFFYICVHKNTFHDLMLQLLNVTVFLLPHCYQAVIQSAAYSAETEQRGLTKVHKPPSAAQSTFSPGDPVLQVDLT